jgi:FAD/FMN-containing dehydrogenase
MVESVTAPRSSGESDAAGALERNGRRWIRPADPEWPADDEWAELARGLSGRLIEPEPLVAALADNPDLLSNPYFIGDQPGGTQMSGWLNAWSPGQSRYAVVAESAEDVAIAVRFADRHNIRLVVKGGGHSLLGTSNAPDSLLVWTRKLSDIELHDSFIPQGAAQGIEPIEAATFGSGCMLMDAYTAVTTIGGRFVQAGECTTVGLTGLVANGGFGNFSKRFGTAASHLVEAEIVTADGRVRQVNAYQDPDLFWALKGGGGGSFGIVTRITLKTHDLPEFFGAASGVVEARSRDAMVRLVERFLQFFIENLDNPHWGGSAGILPDNRLDLALYCQGLDKDTIQSVWAPFETWLEENGHDYEIVRELGAGWFPARSWWDFAAHRSNGADVRFDDRPGAPESNGWWSADHEQVGAFILGCDSVWMAARLLGDTNRLAENLVEAGSIFRVDLHFGRGLSAAWPSARSAALETATNPVMLDAFALAVVGTNGKPRYPGLERASGWETDGIAEARGVREAMKILRRIAPGGGSYISESDYFSESWREDYWGVNADRLARVKTAYDPGGLFEVHHGIRSGMSQD